MALHLENFQQLIFANNTFALLNLHDLTIDLIYCQGDPSGLWNTITIKTLPSHLDAIQLSYVAPYWMVFFIHNEKPYILYTKNLRYLNLLCFGKINF